VTPTGPPGPLSPRDPTRREPDKRTVRGASLSVNSGPSCRTQHSIVNTSADRHRPNQATAFSAGFHKANPRGDHLSPHKWTENNDDDDRQNPPGLLYCVVYNGRLPILAPLSGRRPARAPPALPLSPSEPTRTQSIPRRAERRPMNGLTLLAAVAAVAAVAGAAWAVHWRRGDTMARSQRRAQRTRGALARAARQGALADPTATSPDRPRPDDPRGPPTGPTWGNYPQDPGPLNPG